MGFSIVRTRFFIFQRNFRGYRKSRCSTNYLQMDRERIVPLFMAAVEKSDAGDEQDWKYWAFVHLWKTILFAVKTRNGDHRLGM